jgi:hypothetical protein
MSCPALAVGEKTGKLEVLPLRCGAFTGDLDVRLAHWKTRTFMAALRHDGVAAPFALDGSTEGEWLHCPDRQFRLAQ